MRIELNLATRPTVNRRRFYVLAGSGVVLLLILAVVQAASLARSWSSGRGFGDRTVQLRAGIDTLETEQGALEQDLQQPQARDVIDRSYFLNSLILQKSVSWTQIFMDLEKLMPDRVLVTSIRPEMMENNQVRLDMAIQGESVPQVLEFLRRIEKSDKFGSPVVSTETPPARGEKEASVKVSLSVLYVQK